jgi:hypothetical protein
MQRLKEILDEILAVSHKDESQVIDALYGELPNTGSVRESSDHSVEARQAIRQLLKGLSMIVPKRDVDCEEICNTLQLTDAQRLCVFSVALRQSKSETVWLHFNLAVLLNRLMLRGRMEARFPCLLHSLLALQYSAPLHANEPVPRAILSRELKELAPRDSVREGLKAVSVGVPSAYHDVIAAARHLMLNLDSVPLRPDMIYLQAVANACNLPALSNVRAVRGAQAASLSEHSVLEAENRVLPVPRGDSFHYVFRNAGQPEELPAITIYALEGGTISFDITRRGCTEFYVFDNNDNCISDLSCGISPFIEPDRVGLQGTLAVLGDVFSGPMNVCHFLLDHFTRIALYLQDNNGDLRFLLNENYPYYYEILGIAGYQTQVYRPDTTRFSIRAEKLSVSSNVLADFCHPGHLCASWAMDFLRERLMRSPNQTRGRRRIFISRADARGRNIVNREQVEALMMGLGFEIVTLAGLSAQRQIEIFSAASHVVGVHGAGLTNVVFCPTGTTVLEILPPLVATGAYWVLSTRLGHEYHAFVAEDLEQKWPDYSTWSGHPEYNDRNLLVPIDRLREYLSSMLG